MSENKGHGSSTVRWFLTLAGVSLVAGLTPVVLEAQSSGRSREGGASVTRSDVSQPSQQSRASSQRTTVNRGRSAHRTRSRQGDHRGTRHYGSRRGRSHGSHLYLGYRGYYGYGWPYYSPYYYGYRYGYGYGYPYAYGYPYEWGHRYRRAYSEPLGAFDLDVKPKKTEVYLNGHFIGTASKYDGYPSLLWLPEGEHQLVFFKPGFVTEVREVEALAGVRLDLELDMRPGESTPVKELAVEAKPPPVERRPTVGGRSARAAPPAADRDAAGAPAGSDVLDIRDEPGRLSLRVAPEDAAVYLDGRFLGTGREMAALHAGLLVDAGEHVLSVIEPGRETSLDFSVEPGEEKELTVDLDQL